MSIQWYAMLSVWSYLNLCMCFEVLSLLKDRVSEAVYFKIQFMNLHFVFYSSSDRLFIDALDGMCRPLYEPAKTVIRS